MAPVAPTNLRISFPEVTSAEPGNKSPPADVSGADSAPIKEGNKGWFAHQNNQKVYHAGLTPNGQDKSLNAAEALAHEVSRLAGGKSFDMYIEAPSTDNQLITNRLVIEGPPDVLETMKKAMKVSPGARSSPGHYPYVPGPTGFYLLNSESYKDQLIFHRYPETTTSEVVFRTTNGPSARPNLKESAELLQKELGASVVVSLLGDKIIVKNTEDSWRMMNVPAVFHGHLVEQRSTYLENRLRVRGDLLEAFRDVFEADGMSARADNSPTDFRFVQKVERGEEEYAANLLVQPDHKDGYALRIIYRNGATPKNTPPLPETFTDSKGTVWTLNKFIERGTRTIPVEKLSGTTSGTLAVPDMSQQEITQKVEDIDNPKDVLARSIKTAIEKHLIEHLTGVVPFDVRPGKNAEGQDVFVVEAPTASMEPLKLALLELKMFGEMGYSKKVREAKKEYAEENPEWMNFWGPPPMFFPPSRRGFLEPIDGGYSRGEVVFVGDFGVATPIVLTEKAQAKPAPEQ